MSDHVVAINDLVRDAREIINKGQDRCVQTQPSCPLEQFIDLKKITSPVEKFVDVEFPSPMIELDHIKKEQIGEDFTNYSIQLNVSFWGKADAKDVMDYVSKLLTKPASC